MSTFTISTTSGLDINLVINDVVAHLKGVNQFSLEPYHSNTTVTSEDIDTFLESNKDNIPEEHLEGYKKALTSNFETPQTNIYVGTYLRRMFNDSRNPFTPTPMLETISPSLIKEIREEREVDVTDDELCLISSNVIDQLYELEVQMKKQTKGIYYITLVDKRYSPKPEMSIAQNLVQGRSAYVSNITGINVSWDETRLMFSPLVTVINSDEEYDYYLTYSVLLGTIIANAAGKELSAEGFNMSVFVASDEFMNAPKEATGTYVFTIDGVTTIDDVNIENITLIRMPKDVVKEDEETQSKPISQEVIDTAAKEYIDSHKLKVVDSLIVPVETNSNVVN